MHDADAEERVRAVIALDTVGLGDRRARAALDAALRDPAAEVRVQAASVLWAKSPRRRGEILGVLGGVFCEEREGRSQVDHWGGLGYRGKQNPKISEAVSSSRNLRTVHRRL